MDIASRTKVWNCLSVCLAILHYIGCIAYISELKEAVREIDNNSTYGRHSVGTQISPSLLMLVSSKKTFNPLLRDI